MTATSEFQQLARSEFPALDSGFVYLENAGGSQLPRCVIDAMVRFMTESYVQTTAGYAASDRATEIDQRAHEVSEILVGAEDAGKVVLGPSTTQLTHTLANCYSRILQPGDEIVISIANHEANIAPWLTLERFGVVIKWWGIDPVTGESRIKDLENLLTTKTKIVSIAHTSNLLGNILDVEAIARLVHSVGGRLAVDGVAYASHGFMEAAKWDVDFYAYSTYKVYGPHMAAMYGKSDALAELEGPNHFFVPREKIPSKFEIGCLSWEGCAGLVAVTEYFQKLAKRDQFNRETVRLATGQMRAWEIPLAERLIAYLSSKPSVRIVGPLGSDRMPTVSFVTDRLDSASVAAHVNRHGIGIRNGHMYSHRLTEALGVCTDTGFVRVSAVHYNTLEEIDRLCEVLDLVL